MLYHQENNTMIRDFTLEQKILHYLIIHSLSCSNIGLLHGRMGIALTFYIIGQKQNNDVYIDWGDNLLDSVLENISRSHSYDFTSGLCGIGWGIEYLLHKHLVLGSSSAICEELDESIMKINPNRLDCSLGFGLKGFLHYVLAHISNCITFENKLPFDSVFYDELKHSIQNVSPLNVDFELQRLLKKYNDFYCCDKIDYNFDILEILENKYPLVNDCDFKNKPLSLVNGLSGYLISHFV